jgi:hypothetical protein
VAERYLQIKLKESLKMANLECRKHGLQVFVDSEDNLRCKECYSIIARVKRAGVNTKDAVQRIKKDKYPTVKKGDKITCSGCKGKGIVLIRPENKKTKEPAIKDTCQGCKGKRYFIV